MSFIIDKFLWFEKPVQYSGTVASIDVKQVVAEGSALQ
jgi:hypothetical protein